MYIDVTLQSGRTVRIYQPPMRKIYGMIHLKHPVPEPPVITESGVAGEVSMQIESDPQYLALLRKRDEEMDQETSDMTFLFALKDEVPPDDFDAEAQVGDEMRYLYPDWKPRDGPMGRKLDWIEYDLLASTQDQVLVAEAIGQLSRVDNEEVEAIKASFQTKMER